ncbi:MAG: zinc metalloprotease HtpX [Thermoplasmata archaeon]|jgi:heat shock protein HtpX|nr:M48 family metalloprotease [Euryarchaeota archaeon]MVT35244.1 M48 family metalloprotease [Euryarchaeota archaeon]
MNPTLRTIGLFLILTGLFLLVGYIIGYLYGGTVDALLLFLIIALLVNIFTYFFSSSLVLWSYGAKIINENQEPRVYGIVRKVAQNAGLPMPKVAIIETDIPNAFATGRNKRHAVVAVTRGLLNIMNDDELEGVIGHEMGHVRDRDMLLMTVAATIVGALTYLSRFYLFQSMFSSRERENDIIAMIVLGLAAFGALLLQLAISRQREFKADEMSAKITKKPLSLASALRKIENYVERRPLQNGNPSTASLFIVNPFRGKSLLHLFSTHPPTEERIKRLEKMAMKNSLNSIR